MYGISVTALAWFSSYLTNRTQSVIVNDHISQVSSPILFILYTKPLSDLIQCHSIESHSFADDTQLQFSVPPSNIQPAISSLKTCLSDSQTWMLENELKLNNDETEALLLRSSIKSFSVGKPTTISVCGCEISFPSSARNLGFYIRDDMSVELHIKSVCQSAYSELRRISTIRHLLSADSTKIFVSAIFLSRLDYCNSLLLGCPKHLLEKLQKVQNSAARLVLKVHKRDHVSTLLFTGCPSKHVSNLSCQHSVTPFSLIQPLFICLTFSVSTLHQDSSAPPLIQELCALCTYRSKHLVIPHFRVPLLLSGILCLVKLDPLGIFSQLLDLKAPSRLICSNPTSTS